MKCYYYYFCLASCLHHVLQTTPYRSPGKIMTLGIIVVVVVIIIIIIVVTNVIIDKFT